MSSYPQNVTAAAAAVETVAASEAPELLMAEQQEFPTDGSTVLETFLFLLKSQEARRHSTASHS